MKKWDRSRFYYGSEWSSTSRSSGDRVLDRILETKDLAGGAEVDACAWSSLSLVLSPLLGPPPGAPSTVPPVVLPVSFRLSLSCCSLLAVGKKGERSVKDSRSYYNIRVIRSSRKSGTPRFFLLLSFFSSPGHRRNVCNFR